MLVPQMVDNVMQLKIVFKEYVSVEMVTCTTAPFVKVRATVSVVYSFAL